MMARPIRETPRPRRRRTVTPIRVTVLVAVVGSVAFTAYALTVRDASQIPLLVGGALVLSIVFGLLALAGAFSAYRAAREGRSGRALAAALGGGLAALISAGAITAATVLTMLWTGTGSGTPG
jgi:hypothetical protein